jgi:hypothetical protein
MDQPVIPIADQQRHALGIALDALGLTSTPEDGAHAARVLELEHTVTALLA